MTTVTFSFEGGTNGATVVAGSGAAAGDTNFDNVFSTSSTDIYDNTQAAHGTQSNKIATSGTPASGYNAWTTSIGAQTTVWVRAYLYFTATPAVQHRVINMVGSAASRGNILATTAGTLIFTNSGGGTVLTSAAFPTGNWFRLEAMFTGSATVGQWIYKIWYQPDATGTPSDTQTSAANLNTGGTVDTYRFGIGSSVANAGPFWLDDIGVSTTAFIGPAATQIPAPGQPPRIPRRTPARGIWTQPVTVNTNMGPPVLGAANVFPHLTVARRYPARGWFNAGAGPGNAIPGVTPWTPKPSVTRRGPARAVTRWTPVATVNAAPPPAAPGTVQPKATIPAPRRYPARVTWHGPVPALNAPGPGLLVNTAEGGTSGTTVTHGNSGGASGNAFDSVTIGAGATDAYDSTQAAHGTLSFKIATGGTSTTVFSTWSASLTGTSGFVPQAWFRLYLYFTANPAANLRVFSALNGTTLGAGILVLPGGQLRFINSAGGTILTTTAAIPLNTWFRIEGFVAGDPAAGQVSLSLYQPADSPAATETDTSAATQNTAGPVTQVRYGIGSAQANAGPYWMDDIGVSVTGPLGPAAGPPVTGGLTRSRLAARGSWRAGAGTVNAHGPAVPPPGRRPAVTSRIPARAAWRGTIAYGTNAPAPAVIFTYGTPYFEWAAGTPYFEWAAGDPYLS